jgi:hypothetical protein
MHHIAIGPPFWWDLHTITLMWKHYLLKIKVLVEWLRSYFVIKEVKGSIPSHDIDLQKCRVKMDNCDLDDHNQIGYL